MASIAFSAMGVVPVAWLVHELAARSTSEGTVKAQTAAIYRKAKVTGRPQLLGLVIEDLMTGPAAAPAAGTRPPQASVA